MQISKGEAVCHQSLGIRRSTLVVLVRLREGLFIKAEVPTHIHTTHTHTRSIKNKTLRLYLRKRGRDMLNTDSYTGSIQS